jgi:transcription elongation factor GreB
MSKAFTREDDDDIEDDVEEASPLPAGARNYMTPGGFARLKAELNALVDKDRPEVVGTVSWAASKRRPPRTALYLQEAPARNRPTHPFLIRRLDIAERRSDGSP